ncbi:unnamed protein product [Ectocarpus sp. CCAP 1310/34]|nr:unnamed protein product [Ectocarpus sp. CCAP 1310/34]
MRTPPIYRIYPHPRSLFQTLRIRACFRVGVLLIAAVDPLDQRLISHGCFRLVYTGRI